MTVLGSHTVDEVKYLLGYIDWQITKYEELYSTIPHVPTDLNEDWNAWKTRYAKAHDEIISNMRTLNLSLPLVPDTYLADEQDWQKLLHALNASGGGAYAKGDWGDVRNRIEIASGHTIDWSDPNKPQLVQNDPDLQVYLKADQAAKASQNAVAAVDNAVGKAAKSNIGLIAIGGIGLLAIGAIASKTYL